MFFIGITIGRALNGFLAMKLSDTQMVRMGQVLMACAYVGSSLMPPLFGLIAGHITVSLLPVYLSAILVLMIVMHEGLLVQPYTLTLKNGVVVKIEEKFYN